MDEVPSSRYRLGSFATNKRLLDASRELNFKGGSSSIHAEAINYDDPEHGVHAAAPTKLQPGMEHLTQLLFILCTVGVSESISTIVRLRNSMLQHLMHSSLSPQLRAATSLAALGTLSVGLTCAAAAMVLYWAPMASGAGVSMIMAYLNGNDIPRLFGLDVLLVKVVGVVCGIVANLTIGPEGPMVHVGACCAAMVAKGLHGVGRAAHAVGHAAARQWRRLRGERDDATTESLLPVPPVGSLFVISNLQLREMVTAGAASGLAAAFGAPLGGVLFAVEEARGQWTRRLGWLSLLTASLATMLGAQLRPSGHQAILPLPVAPLDVVNAQWLRHMPAMLVVSTFGGLWGALFNWSRMVLWRRTRRVSTSRSLVEAGAVALLSVLVMCTLALWLGQCRTTPASWATDSYGVPLFCPPGTHNDIATVFFDEHTTSIKHIFGMEMENATQALGHTAPGPAPHVEPPLSNRGLLVVCAAYMALMVLCVGVSVPAGMFMPSIMVGATFGRCFGNVYLQWVGGSWPPPSAFAVASATAALSGLFRSAICLMVIMFEATGAMSMHLPVLLACIVANAIAALCKQDGMYEIDLDHNKRVTYLPSSPPDALKQLRVTEVMTTPVLCMAATERVSRVLHVLQSTRHHAFAVVDELPDGSSELIGLVSRQQLHVLLQAEAFCDARGRYLNLPFGMAREPYEQQLWSMMSNGMSSLSSTGGSSLHQEQATISAYITQTMTSTEAAALATRSSTHAPPPEGGAGHSLLPAPHPSLPPRPSSDPLPTPPPPGPEPPLARRQSAAAPMPAIAEHTHPRSIAAPSPFENHPLQAGGPPGDALLHVPLRAFAHRALHLLRQEASALQAYRALLELDLRHLLVVDQGGGVPVGIVTRKDLHGALHARDRH